MGSHPGGSSPVGSCPGTNKDILPLEIWSCF